MQILATYSHLNGVEFLRYRHEDIWNEIIDIISSIDAERCKSKVSREKGKEGSLLYSPIELNKAFKQAFQSRGWKEGRYRFMTTTDEALLRSIFSLPQDEQKKRIEAANLEAIPSYNQIDFVKSRIAVEIQFGKYSFVAHDLFVKHLSFYVGDRIDLGIEVLPMKSLEREMSSGVAYYERDLLNVVRQGRGVPAVPLIMFGIAP